MLYIGEVYEYKTVRFYVQAKGSKFEAVIISNRMGSTNDTREAAVARALSLIDSADEIKNELLAKAPPTVLEAAKKCSTFDIIDVMGEAASELKKMKGIQP